VPVDVVLTVSPAASVDPSARFALAAGVTVAPEELVENWNFPFVTVAEA